MFLEVPDACFVDADADGGSVGLGGVYYSEDVGAFLDVSRV